MSLIYYPYKSVEEREGLEALHTDITLIGDAHLGNKSFLVYDDGVKPPWEFDEVIKAVVIELLKDLNNLQTIAGVPLTTPQDFKTRVITRLNL